MTRRKDPYWGIPSTAWFFPVVSIGLDNYQEMMRLLVEDNNGLKVYVNVAEE